MLDPSSSGYQAYEQELEVLQARPFLRRADHPRDQAQGGGQAGGQFIAETVERGDGNPSCRRRAGHSGNGHILHQSIPKGKNIDRAWPFDIIPRVIPARDWTKVSRGLAQRSRALNCFIDDIYNKQKILTDGIVPADIVMDSGNYKPQCAGVSPRYGAWAHVCGTDLVRDKDGKFYVLEDNLRVPSGVSLHAGEPRNHQARASGII